MGLSTRRLPRRLHRVPCDLLSWSSFWEVCVWPSFTIWTNTGKTNTCGPSITESLDSSAAGHTARLLWKKHVRSLARAENMQLNARISNAPQRPKQLARGPRSNFCCVYSAGQLLPFASIHALKIDDYSLMLDRETHSHVRLGDLVFIQRPVLRSDQPVEEEKRDEKPKQSCLDRRKANGVKERLHKILVSSWIQRLPRLTKAAIDLRERVKPLWFKRLLRFFWCRPVPGCACFQTFSELPDSKSF